MPELMTGTYHSIDMVMSDSIDTAACGFQNAQARGPPGSLNKSAQDVNHVTSLLDQRGRKRKGGGDGEMREKRKAEM